MTIRMAALALLVLLVGSCASRTHTAAVAPSPSPSHVEITPSASPSTPPSPSPAQVAPSPVPIAPTAEGHIVNRTGHFSFDAPTGWVFLNCDPSYPGVGLAIRAGVHPAYCADEACWFSVLITSVPGDQTKNAPAHVGCMQYIAGSATGKVTVAGIAGTRTTDAFTGGADKTGGFGPDAGTQQVLYVVYNGALTYYALYQRAPNQADETAAFDEMMKSFAFTNS